VKQVLAIDGGGIKGVFPAAFLAKIEEVTGKQIADHFDLIVGTSTGGIIAIGLALGLPAADVLQFYEQYGPQIFAGNRYARLARQVGFAKYRSEPLRRALQDVFGERRIGESRTRLMVPSLHLETGEVHVYKTSHHERLKMDYKELAVDVAMATAAAPTYFPTYRSAAGIPLVDGGMWANNPAGPAAVEALGMLGWKQGDVQLLSLGCTTEALRAKPNRVRRLGLNYWALKLVAVFMSGQSSASHGTAQLLLGHENVVRVSPVVPRKRFALDSAKDIAALRGLGESEARKALPSVERFFQAPAQPFEPYNKLPQADLVVESEK
jgi:patatin-like phospholipase/acyl hydrolase